MRKTPASKATPAKKVKKRNPWSEDESKSDSDVEEAKPVIPRETKSQRASGTVRLNILLAVAPRSGYFERHYVVSLWEA